MIYKEITKKRSLRRIIRLITAVPIFFRTVPILFLLLLFAGAVWASLDSYILGTGQIRMEQAISVNSEGNPGLVYFDTLKKQVCFSQFDGNVWLDSETVDYGYEPSLIFNGNIPCVAYYNNSGEVRCAIKTNGDRWKISLVKDKKSYNVSIGLWKENPCLVYRYNDGTAVRFAHLEKGNWNIETIPTLKMVSQGGAVAISKENDIFVAGHTAGALAVFKSSEWVKKFIEPWSEYTASFSPAYDRIGIPYVSYWRRNVSLKKESGDLRFAKYIDKKWQIETAIHSEFTGNCWDCGYTSLVFDNRNSPWIAYTTADGQDIFTGLFLLHKKGKKWINDLLINEPPNAISMAYSIKNDEIWIAISTRKDDKIVVSRLRDINKNVQN